MIVIYISPLRRVLGLATPFPRKRNFVPDCVPASIAKTTLPYIVGTSFLQPKIASVIVIGKSKKKNTENYIAATRLVKAKISNLESNLHIEIDMERIEDRSKALSYIGIEIAEALKGISAPVEEAKTQEETAVEPIEETEYITQTRFEVRPSLWQRIKNSKLVKTIQYICKIKVVLSLPEGLPEGRQEN